MIKTIPIPTVIIDSSNRPFRIVEFNSFFSSKFSELISNDKFVLQESTLFGSENTTLEALIGQALTSDLTVTQQTVVPYQNHFLKVTIAPYNTEQYATKKLLVLYFEEIPTIYSDQFQRVIENIEGIFWKANATTLEFSYISPQVKKILGYEPKQWLEDQNFWKAHILDEDRDFAINFCHSQTQLGRNHSFEYRMRAADGRIVWIKDVVSVIQMEDGSTELIGLMIDVSDRKVAEEQLLKNKNELKMLLKSAGEGIFALDKEGRCTFINDAAVKMLGLPKDQLLGNVIHNQFHPSSQMGEIHKKSSCSICDPTHLSLKREHQKDVFYKADGSYFDIRYSSVPLIENGKNMGVVVTFADISIQLASERKLLHSKKTMSKILQQSLDLICTFDSETRFTNVNQASLKILGYKPSELIGRKYTDFILAEDLRSTLRTGSLVMKGGSKNNFENRYIRKDGSVVSILWSASWDKEEKIMFCTGKDATELNHARAQLQLNERRLRQLVKGSNDIVAILDQKGECLYVNQTSNPLLGYTAEEFVGQIAFDYIHPSDILAIKETFSNLPLDHIVLPNLFRFYHKDGTWRWIESSLKNLSHDEAIGGIVVNLRDVTLKKTEELRLKLLESVIINMSDAVLVISVEEVEDGEPFIIYCNKAFSEMTGYSLNEIYGKSPSFFKCSEAHNHLVKELSEAFNQRESFECEIEYAKKSGDPIWLNIVLSPIIEDDGQCNLFIVIQRDITERKNAELELKNLYAELEVHAKKLTDSNFELEQFAYVASHDLQEPLRMVTSFLTLLEKRYADKLDDKALEFIFFAVDGATRMRQIILDLLDYSRIGKEEISLEDIDLNLLLAEVWDTFQTSVTELDATLVIEEPLPVIRSFKTPIRQVFQNLISNSLKYVTLGKKPVISISYQSTSIDFEFFVKDNGIGINEQYHEKIFNIFQRLHTKEEYGGTGMGLAITKKIIEGLGGTIRVESIENQESTFIFTIPKNTLL